LDLGFMPSDGMFLTSSFGSGVGFDISLSLQGSIGQYKGYKGKSLLDAKSISGGSWNLIVGAGLFNSTYTKGYTFDKNGGTMFNNWTIYSGGLSIGTKSFLGGSYGPSVTSLPLYLYQFKNK